jgi:uncharacterized protein DUF6335
MKTVRRRAGRDRSPGSPRRPAVKEWSRRGDSPSRRGDSPTAIAAEALRTGVLPVVRDERLRKIPGEDETIRVGDPDDDTLANEYVGEDTPGGSTPTPDQNGVDEIGRVYGLQEEDSGSLHSAGEILSRRDRHRSELKPPRTRS